MPSVAGASFIADPTSLTVRFADNANTYHLANGSTGSFFNITNANWTIIFRAWVYNSRQV
jgi:hypothetical protein